MLLMFTVIIILGLCNIKEDMTLLPTEYRWGLRNDRKKHHRKSTSKKKNKMHNNHRSAYNKEKRANTEQITTLNK